jgi:uncharacterized membrane protein YphA (DoxX/SURF4 family)
MLTFHEVTGFLFDYGQEFQAHALLHLIDVQNLDFHRIAGRWLKISEIGLMDQSHEIILKFHKTAVLDDAGGPIADVVILYVGACELLGSIALLIRPLRALTALGIAIIMVGATYYHAVYTPPFQAAPAFVLLILCVYIFWTSRSDLLRLRLAAK